MGAFAQITDEKLNAAVAEQVAIYKLNASQQSEMKVIQERRLRNLLEIEPLRQSDYMLYLQKLRNIRLGAEKSTRALLTEEQARIFAQRKMDRRKREAEKIQSLREKGATEEEIELALLEMER